MEKIILTVLGIVLGTGIIGGGIFAYFRLKYIAKTVYRIVLVKDTDDKWPRVCSAPDNEEQLAMWNDGLEWAKKNEDVMHEVSIENEGLKLAGEFYDFGSDKAVIILPGRCECLRYSYHYAAPYQKAGISVLVIDSRCHGESEGKYTTIGVAEGRDTIAWAKYLNEKENINKVFIHGICVGGAAAMAAVSSDSMPDCIKGLITEGCFTDFRESFKNHMIKDKRPLFPVLDMVMGLIKKNTGVDVMKECPMNYAPKAKVPALFIFGENDIFSTPDKSRLLIDAYVAPKKEVWLPEGGHSHLRINNTEAYDKAITDFLADFT